MTTRQSTKVTRSYSSATNGYRYPTFRTEGECALRVENSGGLHGGGGNQDDSEGWEQARKWGIAGFPREGIGRETEQIGRGLPGLPAFSFPLPGISVG